MTAALALGGRRKEESRAVIPLGGAGARRRTAALARRTSGGLESGEAGNRTARTAGERTDAERTEGERTEPEHRAGRYNPVTNSYALVRIDNVTRYGTIVNVAAETAALTRRLRVGFFYKVGARMNLRLSKEARAELSAAVDRLRDAADAVGDADRIAGPILATDDAGDYAAEAAWSDARDAWADAHKALLAVLRRQLT